VNADVLEFYERFAQELRKKLIAQRESG
jgi:hypothetical protein